MLTELQGKAADGTLAKTMAAYVRWLASQMEKLKATLPARKTALREEISGQLAVHSRTPDIIASLMLGIEMFLAFALIHGAMSDDEAQQMREKAPAAILDAAKLRAPFRKVSAPVAAFWNFWHVLWPVGHVTWRIGRWCTGTFPGGLRVALDACRGWR